MKIYLYFFRSMRVLLFLAFLFISAPAYSAEPKTACLPGGAFYTKLSGTPEQQAAAMRAKAEMGDAAAQQTLGMMYEVGHGVVKDWVEAVNWLRKAAEQSRAGAIETLGEMYSEGGCGVKQDYAEAYFWLILADHFDKQMAEKYHWASMGVYRRHSRDDTASHLTLKQRTAVENRAKQWLKDHPTQD